MPVKLRLMTYLCPDLPLELFQAFQYYLEEALQVPTCLVVESRYDGPTAVRNPVREGDADIVFMKSSAFLRTSDQAKDFGFELLPVGLIHNHKLSEQRPIVYSDLIIPSARKDIYKEFVDLKGSQVAYDQDGSLAGNLALLAELKANGYNATFFGHTLQSGSHRKSIQMVLQGRANVAAVDSLALDLYLRENPHIKDELTVMTSLGPLPTFPIVISSKLPVDMKKRLEQLFLNMSKATKWGQVLETFNISGFKPIDSSLYDLEKSIHERCQNLTMQPAYY